MTAIGFALLWISLVCMVFVHDKWNSKTSKKEIIGVIGLGISAILIIMGITLWLWEAMP